MKYEVQFEINRGEWVTIAKRSSFKAACAVARRERREMNGQKETAVIREGDPAILRRMTCENFQLV